MNRRVFPRAVYPCRIKVIVKIFSHVFDTYTENIGVGGICVILDKQLRMFSDADLEIYLDDKEGPVRCMGRVVWVVKRSQYIKHKPSQFDTGFEFIDIGSHDRARISSLVDKIIAEEAKDAQD